MIKFKQKIKKSLWFGENHRWNGTQAIFPNVTQTRFPLTIKGDGYSLFCYPA